MRLIAVLQGAYFVLTGVWPLISIDTFQKITGPKTDLWLVKTVGSLIAAVGLVILLAELRGDVAFEIFFLAVGSFDGFKRVNIAVLDEGQRHFRRHQKRI